jgi:hypothetical protein
MKKANKPQHKNLTEENLENLQTVNLDTNEWKIRVGNTTPEKEPRVLKIWESKIKPPPPLKSFGTLPAWLQPKGNGV